MPLIRHLTVVLFGLLLTCPQFANADTPTRADITYGMANQLALKLDFYEPMQRRPERPLLIWIHGGAWRSGSKSDVPVSELRKHGFAIASVDYRLSPVARFPAQIHDIKAAIRYLRLHAHELGVDEDRFVLGGASAGGHLAVLAAVTNGVEELEGDSSTGQPISSKSKRWCLSMALQTYRRS